MTHNFWHGHWDIKMGITDAVGRVINKGISIAFIAKVLPWINERHGNGCKSSKSKQEADNQREPHRGGRTLCFMNLRIS
jgi:hypothetical protein